MRTEVGVRGAGPGRTQTLLQLSALGVLLCSPGSAVRCWGQGLCCARRRVLRGCCPRRKCLACSVDVCVGGEV